MTARYTYAKQTDMLLAPDFCEGNLRQSVRVYQERFPNRYVPNYQTFANIERRLRKLGVHGTLIKDFVRNPDVEEEILERLEEDPGASWRGLSRQIRVSKNVVHKVIKEQLLRPYHIQSVQELLSIDPDACLTFCQIIPKDINFHNKTLFTDEACFTRKGIINVHNEHVYADENQHAIRQRHFQHGFRVNVWAGIIRNCIIGLVSMPTPLNGVVQGQCTGYLSVISVQGQFIYWVKSYQVSEVNRRLP
ncbi:hypothetical protein ILUMI_04879 [Ignelater luminosus]|uniref:DUF4817 domain-containing protein n=1 Tax=Ignelater luminosus TaxID=2038154 RepID=A0A8K0DC07_IGNLU|nr:hypothetical protein ILUMI_04879 [Ignelater luminosus]